MLVSGTGSDTDPRWSRVAEQVGAVREAVLPDGRDVRVRGDLVGGGRARVLLVRDGRGELAARRVRVLHILLEAVGARPVAGPRARAGVRALRPAVRAARVAPPPELLVVVRAPPTRRQPAAQQL